MSTSDFGHWWGKEKERERKKRSIGFAPGVIIARMTTMKWGVGRKEQAQVAALVIATSNKQASSST